MGSWHRGMEQEGTTFDGEASALIRAGTAIAAEASVSPQWLIDLKARADEMRQGREPPPGKSFGRWLWGFSRSRYVERPSPRRGEAPVCSDERRGLVLESRAVLLWAAFNSWRETIPEAPAEDLNFVELIARFTETAPEPVQDVIIEATRHAIEELRLPAYWEPKSVAMWRSSHCRSALSLLGWRRRRIRRKPSNVQDGTSAFMNSRSRPSSNRRRRGRMSHSSSITNGSIPCFAVIRSTFRPICARGSMRNRGCFEAFSRPCPRS